MIHNRKCIGTNHHIFSKENTNTHIGYGILFCAGFFMTTLTIIINIRSQKFKKGKSDKENRKCSSSRKWGTAVAA